MNTNMILIIGVTASGKATLAFDLARQLDTDIISVDSMKIYRRMDIGTAKPSPEKQQQINYHLIDVVEPSEEFSVASYLDLANKAIDQIKAQNKPVIAVGGTALYIKALLHGLFKGPGTDPEIRRKLKELEKEQGLIKLYEKLKTVDPQAADRIHPNDSKRVIRALEVHELTGQPISSFQTQFESEKLLHNWTIIGLRRQKELESHRINLRVKKMVEMGLVDEVKNLLAEDNPLSRQAACAIGYAEIIDHLNGKIPLDDAIEKIKVNTRRLAKHQRTWFKRFPNVNWLDLTEADTPQTVLEKANKLLEI